MDFVVKYRGKNLNLTPPLDPTATQGDLRARVAGEVGSEVEKTRLLVSGKALPFESDANTPLTTVFPPGKRVVIFVMATPKATQDVVQIPPDVSMLPRLHDDTGIPSPDGRSFRFVATPSRTRSTANNMTQQDYGFGIVESLKEYPNHVEAQRVLERLASDAGVLSAMREKKWFVGALREMPPQGRVGVDTCLMGYNVGRGREIRLRLRTDDHNGFRQVSQLLHVLAHELAHNVEDGHGVAFKETMRWVERRIETNSDWRGSGGRSLADGMQAPGLSMNGIASGAARESANTTLGGGGSGRTIAVADRRVRSSSGRGGVGGDDTPPYSSTLPGIFNSSRGNGTVANSRRSRLLDEAERNQEEQRRRQRHSQNEDVDK